MLHRFLVANDVSVSGAAIERSPRTMRDVSQVTQKGALVTLGDFRIEVERFVCADCRKKIDNMLTITLARARRLLNLLVRRIVKHAVRSVAIEFQGSVGAIECHKAAAMPVATLSLPTDLLLAFEFKTHSMCVWRLLIVIPMVSIAA